MTHSTPRRSMGETILGVLLTLLFLAAVVGVISEAITEVMR